ncbi:MAG: Sporulation initiation inhibitor protein Soj [Anaerolineae bacterium]|nr:Sporulation initiation inhibitor protein Soj [Anaerolineae bacterium]
MITLAVYSNKGGVGKTTTAVNLAYLAAQGGASTLICDLDPQSATTFFFRVKPKLKKKARGLVQTGDPIERSIKGTDYDNLDLLPADFTHRNLDINFDKLSRPRFQLHKALASLTTGYDLVFLDCPPTINILAENIFNAAAYLVVPVTPTTLAVRTLEQLLDFLDQRDFDPARVLPFFSMVDLRDRWQKRTAAAAYRQFAGLLRHPVPYLPVVEQMSAQREPVAAFAPNSPAADYYRQLWQEIQNHINPSETAPARS